MKTHEFSLDFLELMVSGIAGHFGNNCEVSLYDINTNHIIIIENGHVTDRKIGDRPSKIVKDALRKNTSKPPADKLCFVTKTSDGRTLKSTILYIKNNKDIVIYLFVINFDITSLVTVNSTLLDILETKEHSNKISGTTKNINEVLEELIEQSVQIVGKPVSQMSKDDKVKAINYLNEAGAFLITKSGDKVSKHFGISKFTLYNYLDAENT